MAANSGRRSFRRGKPAHTNAPPQPAFKRQGDRPEPQESYFQHAAKDGPGNPEHRQYGTEHDKSRAGFRPGSGPMLGAAGFGIRKAHMFHSQPGQGGT